MSLIRKSMSHKNSSVSQMKAKTLVHWLRNAVALTNDQRFSMVPNCRRILTRYLLFLFYEISFPIHFNGMCSTELCNVCFQCFSNECR